MGGNKDLVVKNVGGSPSNNQQNVVSDGVDPLVSNQMLQGNQAGFDIIMAHEDEETLVTIVDGPKRPRTNPPASGVSIIDSNDVSNYVSAGLAQQGPKKLLSWNVRGLGKSQTVSELMDAEGRHWNDDLVSSTFNTEDSTAILSIKLPRTS
ncbi:hypothetical protein V6N13_042531 [Hibiscus sabdariffa]